MQAQEIINQLKGVLPKYTSDFTTNYTISSLTRSSSTVTATTSSDHGLIAGNKVLIKGAKTPITVSSLTRNGVNALAITATDHNLIKNQTDVEISGADQADYNGTQILVWKTPVIYIESITIAGTTATVTTTSAHGLLDDANIEVQISGVRQFFYNGNFALDSVPTTTTFTITVQGITENGSSNGSKPMQMQLLLNSKTFMFEVSGSPTTPATGTITQIFEYKEGYNGYKTILTVPTSASFTYAITSTPNSPAQGTISARVWPTVAGFVTYERASDYFVSVATSGQSNKWVFVVLDDENVNKNNFNRTDAVSYNAPGLAVREQSYQNVTIYIFLPCGATNDEVSYIVTRDAGAAYKPHIYKALLGFAPSSGLSDDYYSRLTPVANGMKAFTGSYYAHYFTFQASCWANQSDAVAPDDLSAFRTFDFDVIDNEGFDTSVMEIVGDVD
tara:strand:+ start:10995 stop:12332 length:1338 start_codon:yes stop_codon:yes gene_type:complete